MMSCAKRRQSTAQSTRPSASPKMRLISWAVLCSSKARPMARRATIAEHCRLILPASHRQFPLLRRLPVHLAAAASRGAVRLVQPVVLSHHLRGAGAPERDAARPRSGWQFRQMKLTGSQQRFLEQREVQEPHGQPQRHHGDGGDPGRPPRQRDCAAGEPGRSRRPARR